MDTATSRAGTLETLVMRSGSPLEDSRRVIVNASAPRNRDGIDERSFRWKCFTGASSTDARGAGADCKRFLTMLLLITYPQTSRPVRFERYHAAMVQSNANDQCASLVAQQQSLIAGVDVVFRQTHEGGCHVFDNVGDSRGSRNRQNHRGSREQPCQCDL